jgi:predicted ATPase
MSGNLPYLLSSFIGRQAELEAVKQLLVSRRLVTLTGPGGVGKTRLALAAAAAVSERQPDGIFLVELASLTDERLVVQTVATSIGVREMPEQDWLDGLIEGLNAKQSLLLLDNCEHLH